PDANPRKDEDGEQRGPHLLRDQERSDRLNADAAMPAAAQAQSKHALRVFLVEDLPVVRNRVIESLEEISGLEVAGFAEGEESALSWLGSHDCDVLIVDLQLRQGNGLGILKSLADVRP